YWLFSFVALSVSAATPVWALDPLSLTNVNACLAKLHNGAREANAGDVSCSMEQTQEDSSDVRDTAAFFGLPAPTKDPTLTYNVETPHGDIYCEIGPYAIPVCHFSFAVEKGEAKEPIHIIGAYVRDEIRSPLNSSFFDKVHDGQRSPWGLVWYHNSAEEIWEKNVPWSSLPADYQKKVQEMATLCHALRRAMPTTNGVNEASQRTLSLK
ncbi:MAG: hypothetical protein AB7E52_02255, partial [Bdellovibrionales bacterium]